MVARRVFQGGPRVRRVARWNEHAHDDSEGPAVLQGHGQQEFLCTSWNGEVTNRSRVVVTRNELTSHVLFHLRARKKQITSTLSDHKHCPT